jgi:predicted regulator of Ras-like GTPase activity (Roadblock/LC7/MglB family)
LFWHEERRFKRLSVEGEKGYVISENVNKNILVVTSSAQANIESLLKKIDLI